MLRDAAVLIADGRIAAVGPYRDLKSASRQPPAEIMEVSGVLYPGFVDCHTHAVFAGPRLDDHQRRALGETYQTIAAAGGGILESMRGVRGLDEDALFALTLSRVTTLLAHGTTTVEIKSGYGLSAVDERKQLRVAARIAERLPLTVVPTLLAAHSLPPEFRDRRADYVRLVCEEIIPAVAREGLARACDVFCEPGAFSVDESRTILLAARAHGLRLRLHADELEGSGGAELAADLGADTADHLAAIAPSGIAALARAPTIAVLLPATMAFLGTRAQAPARRRISTPASTASRPTRRWSSGSTPC